MANRGQLTEQIQVKAKEFLGREITMTEFRLLPYIDYVMKNEQALVPAKINRDESDFLAFLRLTEHAVGGASGMAISKEFYDFMQEVLWLGYVAYEEF